MELSPAYPDDKNTKKYQNPLILGFPFFRPYFGPYLPFVAEADMQYVSQVQGLSEQDEQQLQACAMNKGCIMQNGGTMTVDGACAAGPKLTGPAWLIKARKAPIGLCRSSRR